MPALLKKPSRRPGYRNRTVLPQALDVTPFEGRVDHFPAVQLELVSRTAQEKLYNGLIGAYHYLGYRQGTGEQLNYVISLPNRPLAAISFSAAAWRLACRDHFIGWDDQARRKNLPLVVNNHRFLLVLVETFVEKKRFHGTCYRAANWIGVGETVGRGRNDRTSTNWLPIKQVYLYPLESNFRQRCQTI